MQPETDYSAKFEQMIAEVEALEMANKAQREAELQQIVIDNTKKYAPVVELITSQMDDPELAFLLEKLWHLFGPAPIQKNKRPKIIRKRKTPVTNEHPLIISKTYPELTDKLWPPYSHGRVELNTAKGMLVLLYQASGVFFEIYFFESENNNPCYVYRQNNMYFDAFKTRMWEMITHQDYSLINVLGLQAIPYSEISPVARKKTK